MPKITCCGGTRRIVWVRQEDEPWILEDTNYAVCTCGRQFWFCEPPWKRLRADAAVRR